MDKNIFVNYVTKVFRKRLDLCMSKSHDYATEDILANFKRVAKLCKTMNVDVTCPEGVAMFFIIHKLDRENNLKLKKSAKCESRADTMEIDLPNYIDLYNALRAESIKKPMMEVNHDT